MPKIKPTTSQKADDRGADSETGYNSEPSSSRMSSKSRASHMLRQPCGSKLQKQKTKQVELKRSSVDRWIKKLQESENLNSGFIQILGEIQNNIIDHLETIEENLYTFLKQKFCTIQADENSRTLFFSKEIEHNKQILKVKLPIFDLELFMEFDQSLGDDKKKFNAFRNLITCITAGSHHIDHDINTIMHSTITQKARFNYSGAGRTYGGIKKENFSITNVYHCMEDLLTEKYEKSTIELKIKDKVCRWFSTRNYNF
ncbi:uncharacterized protein LOC103317482 [Nasonia vitripennis]|uniref:DUF4806 domain-containing protein n=1 Tax=Nasonia vitripennis TaxID=7425 RepID=A0A7M7H8L9_NASVI|nr:uncharacterized protein LOC103317482 [Nasonia vitripennis]